MEIGGVRFSVRWVEEGEELRGAVNIQDDEDRK